MTKPFRTIGTLVKFLQKLDQDAVPVCTEPPFNGVRVTIQDSGNIMFRPPPRDPNEPRVGYAKPRKRKK